MTIALDLPDVVFATLSEDGDDVVKAAELTLVCGLYRESRLSAVDAMRSLGIASRAAFEALVARHHAERDWPEDEVARELATIEALNRA